MGEGRSPASGTMVFAVSIVGSGTGTADSSACVYGCWGLAYSACTGPIFDRGYLRLLLLIGSFGVVFGFMMLSLCKEFWQAMLAQGFCIGLGGGMLFVPSVAILPTYFSTKIGLAIGLAAAGSSMGGEFENDRDLTKDVR